MRAAKRQLTARQTIAVLLGSALVAAVVYGAYLAGLTFMHRRAVRAVIPKYLDGLRGQRDQLAQAIERYHVQFGFYPQNHTTNSTQRAVLNPLYYELLGTLWVSNYQAFRLSTTKDLLKIDRAMSAFNMSSFSNSLAAPAEISPTWPTNFLDHLGFVGREEDDVFLVCSGPPDGIDDAVVQDFNASNWRYAADPAEHNPGKYDLWIDLDVLDQHFVIGNWEKVR
jgi:hypothetical protein